MMKLKLFLLAVELILLISSVSSFDKDLLEELVRELRSFEKSLKKDEDKDPTALHLTTEATKEPDDSGGNDSEDLDKNVYKEAEKCENCWKLPSESDIVRAIMRDISTGTNSSRACGKDQPLLLRTPRGTIQSPGFHDNMLNNNSKCSWRIFAPEGKRIKITFLVFDLPFDEDCSLSFVEVFDVRSGMPISLGKYCGNTNPSELLQSSGQDMYLYFATDSVIRPGRFSIKFEFVDQTLPTLSSPNCGHPSIKPDVTQSFSSVRPALAGSWPWQVSIRLAANNQKNSHVCGGSIIKPHVVLTGAHCWFLDGKQVNTSEYEVVAGEYDLMDANEGSTKISSIAELLIHENYHPSNSSNDIALVILESPIVFDERIHRVCLPPLEFALSDLCYSTGWSNSKSHGDRTILHQTRLQIIPQTVCEWQVRNATHLTEKQFCARPINRGKETCQGDSGGPLVCYNEDSDRWFQFGVSSYGVECGHPNAAEIYTRVTSYLEWILKHSEVHP